jgi:membrane-bound lytic murein transglycosylase MltF
MGRTKKFMWPLISLLFASWACSQPETPAVEAQEETSEEVLVASAQTVSDEPFPEDFEILRKRWFGDFDEMVERRYIRALVSFSLTNYFLDGATQKGITYDALKMFEEEINSNLKTGHLKFHVVVIPVRRELLISAIAEGRGDIAAANLTITPERQKQVDFSDPLATNISEVVVTGPSAPPLESLEDLSGREIVVRRSSSYHESLTLLNGLFEQRGLAPVTLTPAEEHLEDEDLLEMVNAGLIPQVVVDSHKAAFWEQIFSGISVHEDIAVATGGQIAWAFRKDSPQLREVVNAFVKKHKAGTLMGNILIKKYLRNTKWAKKAMSESELDKFKEMVNLFRKYAAQYDFDALMIAAQGYQESGLDQSKVSPAGAVGVMQIKPSTAADNNVGIPEIHNLENNIHAGTKYLRFIRDRYFSGDDIDEREQTLFSFAAYNAGPARVARLRKKAAEMGLDPNLWFDNVEVAAAKDIGRETVQYVSNIYKYYLAYTRVVAELDKKGKRPVS